MGWDGMLFTMRNANAAIVQCMSYSFLNERIWVKLSFSLAGICGEENAPSSSSHNHKIYFDNNIYNTTIFLLWIILKRNLILPFVLLFLSIPRLCPALVLCMLVEMFCVAFVALSREGSTTICTIQMHFPTHDNADNSNSNNHDDDDEDDNMYRHFSSYYFHLFFIHIFKCYF